MTLPPNEWKNIDEILADISERKAQRLKDLDLLMDDYLVDGSEAIKDYGQNIRVYYIRGHDGWYHFAFIEDRQDHHTLMDCRGGID